MIIAAGGVHRNETVKTESLQTDCFRNARIIIGLSPAGRNQWRGELYELALFNYILNKEALMQYHTKNDKNDRLKVIQSNQPSALFSFSGNHKGIIYDDLNQGWNLLYRSFQNFSDTKSSEWFQNCRILIAALQQIF